MRSLLYPLARLTGACRYAYLTLMMQVVARALSVASRFDGPLRAELKAFPAGDVIEMCTPGKVLYMAVRVRPDGTLERVKGAMPGRAQLSIRFKHIAHAFLVFSFQEGTARAFANDRMVADGDVALATRLVRCLDRLESLILPAFLARRAVKRYTPMSWRDKAGPCARIYLGMFLGLISFGSR